MSWLFASGTLGAQLIITHHPLMISPIRSLTDDAYEGRLIRRLVKENISHIAAHTNLDQAPGGINDTLAELCGLTEISGEGFLRCGLLPAPLTAAEYARALRHNQKDPLYNPDFRQLVHVSYKIAAELATDFYAALQRNADVVAGQVKENILDRHIARLFE